VAPDRRIPAERIQRRSGKDNYWDMGVPGPGPCSEIYYYYCRDGSADAVPALEPRCCTVSPGRTTASSRSLRVEPGAQWFVALRTCRACGAVSAALPGR